MITITRGQISPDTLRFHLKDSTTESQGYNVTPYKKLKNGIETFIRKGSDGREHVVSWYIDQFKPCDVSFSLKPVPEVIKYFVRISYSNGEFEDLDLNTKIEKLEPVVPREIPTHWSEPTSPWDKD